MHHGQEKREKRIGNTVERFDEPMAQNPPALWVGPDGRPFGGRSIHWIDRLSASLLRRSADGTASPFAPRLADRLVRAQRRLRKSDHNRL